MSGLSDRNNDSVTARDPSCPVDHEATASGSSAAEHEAKTSTSTAASQRSSLLERELDPSTLPPHHTPHQPSPLQPHSSLCLYADKLRTLYTQSELPQYSNPACYKWTPSPSKKYIDLLTIDRRKMTTQQVNECKKAALYGQITRKGSSNSVKLEEILQAKPGEKLECVLVEGPPGIGKSTLAWQVCHCWGKRELFQQYSTVLLLPLRDQRVQRATCMNDLFISADTKLQERVHKELSQEDWDGKDTLIILEGLDELPSHLLSQSSIFTALLSGVALSQATILVTSRPSAKIHLQLYEHWIKRISRFFVITGFTDENIDKYAQSVLSDHEQLSGFREYVSTHPRIRSILYVPLHCVIAVTVYLRCQQSRTPPPKTLTGLYTCLTQTILSQYLNDHPQYTGGDYTLDTVFDLRIPRPVHNYFKELCRIAFEHVRDQQLIFCDMPKELHDLGFTDAVPELLLYQQSANYSYNFLHLSVQEFLAAYHISLMSRSEQEQLLKTKCNESHFMNVFQFVAGITKFEGLNKVVVRQAIGIQENTSEQSGVLNKYSNCLELLYECQDVSILDTEYTYSVRLYDPLPHLCLALGYCIANSSCRWKLILNHCSNATQAEMILQGLKESKASHTSYSIKSIRCEDCSTDFTHKLFTQHTPETFIASTELLCFTSHSTLLTLPLCLPELIPRMERLNTLILESVHDTSPTELIPALSRVPTLRNLRIVGDPFKMTKDFSTGTIEFVNCTSEFLNQLLPALPQQTIAHTTSLIVRVRHEPSLLMPPCLPKLIPGMERLNTLVLENVHDTSPTELIPALSRVPTLRNLRMVVQKDSFRMRYLTEDLSTGNIEFVNCTSEFLNQLLPALPQQSIAHTTSLIVRMRHELLLMPPCLPKLIPRMERLNTLILENVHDISPTELIPALSRVPTLRNLLIVVKEDLFRLAKDFSTGTIEFVNCTSEFLNQILPALPQQTIAHTTSLIVRVRHEPLLMPPCLPELIPRMERLNTLVLDNVLDTSPTELIPALSRVPTLRNLQIVVKENPSRMRFLAKDPSTGTIEFVNCTSEFLNQILPALPQQTIAHTTSLIVRVRHEPLLMPPCLPKLIPRMERLNTLVLENVHDTSPTELIIPVLSRVSTLRNLTMSGVNPKGITLLCEWLPTCQLETLTFHGQTQALAANKNKITVNFSNNSIEAIKCQNCTAQFIDQILLQLPQQSITHIETFTIWNELYHNQPLPPCLPELIPRMERLNTLTLKNVLDTLPKVLPPALSRVPTLRNLQTVNFFEMKFSVKDLSTGTIECENCTPEFFDQILPALPQQSIAHITSLRIETKRTNDWDFLWERKGMSYQKHVPLPIPHCLPELILRMERLNTLTLKNVLDTSLNELMPALSRVPTLRNLTLLDLDSFSFMHTFTSKGIFCMYLPTNQLNTLKLSPLSPNDLEMLSQTLHTVSSLETLDIQRSKFTFQSMQAFASMLQQNQSLTEVNISMCSIDSDSACCLAEALHHNTTLRKLDMSGNPVGERGALAMAEMLKHNTTLEELDLEEEFCLEECGDSGIKALVESLAVNQHLKKLTILYKYKKYVEFLSVYHEHKERVELKPPPPHPPIYHFQKSSFPSHFKQQKTQKQEKFSLTTAHTQMPEFQEISPYGGMNIYEDPFLTDWKRQVTSPFKAKTKSDVLALSEHVGSHMRLTAGELHSSKVQTMARKKRTMTEVTVPSRKGLTISNVQVRQLGSALTADEVWEDEYQKQVLGEQKEPMHKGSLTAIKMLSKEGSPSLEETLLSPSIEPLNLPESCPEFVDPVEVIHCNASGGVYYNPLHGITLRIPEGAVPHGMELEISIGVCLYGNFSFPGGLSPVSAIVWWCTQNKRDFKFLKPVELIIPHFLDCPSAEDAESLEMCFLKANHQPTAAEGFQFCPTGGLMDFTSLSGRGILHTRHFCYGCIAANISNDRLKKEKFYVTCAVPYPITTQSPILFYVTYYLPTCIADLELQLQKLPKQLNMDIQFKIFEQRIFLFSDELIRGKISEQHTSSGNTVTVTLQPRAISKSALDFWKLYEDGHLELMERRGEYPPSMRLRICELPTKVTTCTVTFGGTEKSEEEMAIELTVPTSNTVPPSPGITYQATTDSISLQDQPTLHQLTLLKTELKKIHIIQQLAPRWRDLGIMINFDPVGDRINLIDEEFKRESPESCCTRVLQDWLRGRGQHSPTWANLIQILEDMDFPNLAMEIKNFLC